MSQAAGRVTPDAGMLGFSLLGRRVRARGVPAAVAEWLQRNWHFPEYDGHAPASTYAIVLDVGDGAPRGGGRNRGTAGERAERVGRAGGVPDPGAVAADRTAATIAPGWRGCDTVWESGTSSAGVRLSLDDGSPGHDTPGTGTAHILGWGLDDPATHPEHFAALQLAMCEALRASGLLPLHASVAARDGTVSAFLARSGTGKSTTLLHAVRAGWSPIAEDFAWVDPETLSIYGWDRGIRLWPAGYAAVQARGKRSSDSRSRMDDGWRPEADGKLFLDYAALDARSPRHGVLTELVLLARDGTAAAGWEPLPPRDAVRAVWEATGVPLAPATRAWVAHQIPRMLDRVGTRRLRLGSGPPSL